MPPLCLYPTALPKMEPGQCELSQQKDLHPHHWQAKSIERLNHILLFQTGTLQQHQGACSEPEPRYYEVPKNVRFGSVDHKIRLRVTMDFCKWGGVVRPEIQLSGMG